MKSVTICASNRFAKEAQAFAKELRKKGVVVFTPHFYTATYGDLDTVKAHHKKFIALGLTLDHFQKIRKADVISIYNKGGYSGNSVTLEIGYATALDKPVYAFSDKDAEVCRDILFEGYVKTPQDFVKLLK